MFADEPQFDENTTEPPMETIESEPSLSEEQVVQQESLPLEQDSEEAELAEEPIMTTSADGPIVMNDVDSADLASTEDVSFRLSCRTGISILS